MLGGMDTPTAGIVVADGKRVSSIYTVGAVSAAGPYTVMQIKKAPE